MTALLPLERAHIEYDVAWDRLEIFGVAGRRGTKVTRVCPTAPPVFQEHEAGELVPRELMFALDRPSAQALFDALYKAGLRPSSGEATEAHRGELAATRAHLEDMRRIALARLDAPNDELKIELSGLNEMKWG